MRLPGGRRTSVKQAPRYDTIASRVVLLPGRGGLPIPLSVPGMQTPAALPLPKFLEGWASVSKLSLFLTALAVFVTAFASIEYTRQTGRVAVIWPPNAIMLTVMLRSPRQHWIPILLAGYAANVTADWLTADPFGVALLLSACNTIEIVVSILLFARFVEMPPDLTRAGTFAKFMITCGLIGPVCSAAAAAVVLSILNDISPWPVFQTWFAADSLGVLLIVPLLLMLRSGEWRQIAYKSNRHSTAGILLLVAIVSGLIFTQRSACRACQCR